MMPKPLATIKPNTLEFEIMPLVKPTGFREYDARWWFNGIGHEKEPELNFTGVQALGLGMATLFHEMGVTPKVVTGHDFRSISQPRCWMSALPCRQWFTGASSNWMPHAAPW